MSKGGNVVVQQYNLLDFGRKGHNRKSVNILQNDRLGALFQNIKIKLRAAVVHLNFRARSTFPVPVCTVSPGHLINKPETQ